MDDARIARIEARLLEDPLGNVMGLKFLSLFGPRCQGGLIDDADGWASWFYHPPVLHLFDAKTYPNYGSIVYWNAGSEGAARRSIRSFPPAALVKVSSEPCLSLARERWALVNTFVWYSADGPVSTSEVSVQEYPGFHEDLLEISGFNGYGREALVEQERRGCRWFVARSGPLPSAICFIQPNYGAIWEISGVFVRPEARQRGLAKAVVAAAVHHLQGRGLTARYFVHDQNFASLGVVQSLGLTLRGQTQHFSAP